MLPKPEKNKKPIQGAEQLDLVDSLSQENKLARKRRFTLIFLILTVGLSIGFWMYRTCRFYITTNTFPQINFHLPKFNPGLDLKFSSNDLNTTISSLIAKDKNNWSIYTKTVATNSTPFEYSLNFADISTTEQTVKDLINLPVSLNSQTQTHLPKGTQVREIINSENNGFEIKSLVAIPQKQILYIIKFSGSNLKEAQEKVPLIIEKIYWQLMNSDT